MQKKPGLASIPESKSVSNLDKSTLVPNPNLRVEPLPLIKSANQQWARKTKSVYEPKMDPNNVAFHKAALANRLANDRNENYKME